MRLATSLKGSGSMISSHRAALASVFVFALTIGMVGDCAAQDTPMFEQEYERFKDYTALTLHLGVVVKGEDHKVKLRITQIYRGEGRKPQPSPGNLAFMSDSSDGWVYLKLNSVVLLVDGERMRFEADHDGTVGRGYVLEYMYIRPKDEQWKKILHASVIEGKIGNDEFNLDTDQLAAIKEFAALEASPNRATPRGRFVAPPKPKTPEQLEAERETKRREEEKARREEEEAGREEVRRKEAERSRKEVESKKMLDGKLSIAKALEKSNIKGAIEYYKAIVKDYPDTPQAKAATARLKALEPKKR